MRWLRWYMLLILIVCTWLSAACLPRSSPAVAPGALPTQSADGIRRLTILYTNDEHGWIAAQPQKGAGKLGGAAELLGCWKQMEGYTPDGPYLVLSGGDMWTGPAISSWFSGDPAVEVMNLMGYRAAAIGNHEFDFGVETLRRHAREARFPFLSANLVQRGTREPPDFAKPFSVVEVAGIKVGLIGLTATQTPEVTNPQNVAGFEFLPYAATLQRYVPQVKAMGVDLVVVLAHVCGTQLRGLASTARGLGVQVLTAGHCHEQIAEDLGGLALIGGGQYMQSYARLVLDVDVGRDAVVGSKAEVVRNVTPAEGPAADETVAARVAHWQAQADKALGQVIGYTRNGLPHRSDALLNLVTDAWLWAYGTADAAVTNRGGFRQGIDPGPITLADVVGVLPFNNTIVDVTVTGAQLKENLDCCGGAIGGLRYRDGLLTTADGQPLDLRGHYHVLINDFMAGGGDNYRFGRQDPQAYNTAIDWRQPVIDYIRHWATDEAKPLERYLDATARMPP